MTETTDVSSDTGLYGKYEVTEDGSAVEDCFVLEPETDPAARAALATYAEQTDDEDLQRDLQAWLASLRNQPGNAPRPGGDDERKEHREVCVWCGLFKLPGGDESRCLCDSPRYETMSECEDCGEMAEIGHLRERGDSQHVCPDCDRPALTDGGGLADPANPPDLGTVWYVVAEPRQDPARVVAGPIIDRDAASRRASTVPGRAKLMNGVWLVHNVRDNDYNVVFEQDSTRPDALTATDGGTTHGRRADRDEPGIVIAALPYCCRVCGTETDLYVDAKEADDGYEVDGHTNRVQRIGCETCGQERVHVVAVKGIDEPHERPPIQSYREAADG